MNRSILETVLGVVVIATAVGFGVFGLQFVNTHTGHAKYTAYAYFNNVGGLKSGADVRVNGVLVGKVKNIVINTDVFKAEVVMDLSDNIVLPMDTKVSIADASLIGGKYIRLDMGRSKDVLENGGTLKNTLDVVSLEQMLGKMIFLGTQ